MSTGGLNGAGVPVMSRNTSSPVASRESDSASMSLSRFRLVWIAPTVNTKPGGRPNLSRTIRSEASSSTGRKSSSAASGMAVTRSGSTPSSRTMSDRECSLTVMMRSARPTAPQKRLSKRILQSLANHSGCTLKVRSCTTTT